jgi:acetyltransferase-like isoleucine patch superfamily enzyme
MLKLDRHAAWISKNNPVELEAVIRGLITHYFFHVSDKHRLEIDLSSTPGGKRIVNLLTPTVFKGHGRFVLAPTTVFGVPRSPGSYGCTYVESRTPESLITFGDGTVVNNRGMFLSEGAEIRIGHRVLIGPEIQVFDSNAHESALGRRHIPDSRPKPVIVEDDVFIGSRVILLKGCRIGRGSIVSAGTVVPPGFEAPPLSVIAGNPARIVGQVADETQRLEEEATT